ncbi:MAG: FtsX-like permease family protein, partial [Flavobacteriales bacterium]|nr:FtsX-like permease family protein [Flavobacteriales bacterium]
VWLVHEHGHSHEEEQAGAAHDHEDHAGEEADSLHVHDEHDHEGHDHAHGEEEEREVTAYLLKKSNRGAFGMLSRQVENTTMQLANVAIQNNRLLNNFGIGLDTLRVVAVLIMVISFLSVFISLYNSLKERRYELALMRTMGSTRFGIFQLMLGEGLLLSLIGFALGILFSRLALAVMSHYMNESFHYSFDQMGIITHEWILLAITLSVGILASLLPAWRALRIDISKTLANE